MLITQTDLYRALHTLIGGALAAASGNPDAQHWPAGETTPAYVLQLLEAAATVIERHAGVAPDPAELRLLDQTAAGHSDYHDQLARYLAVYADVLRAAGRRTQGGRSCAH